MTFAAALENFAKRPFPHFFFLKLQLYHTQRLSISTDFCNMWFFFPPLSWQKHIHSISCRSFFLNFFFYKFYRPFLGFSIFLTLCLPVSFLYP